MINHRPDPGVSKRKRNAGTTVFPSVVFPSVVFPSLYHPLMKLPSEGLKPFDLQRKISKDEVREVQFVKLLLQF